MKVTFSSRARYKSKALIGKTGGEISDSELENLEPDFFELNEMLCLAVDGFKLIEIISEEDKAYAKGVMAMIDNTMNWNFHRQFSRQKTDLKTP